VIICFAALLLGRVTYQGFAQAWPLMGTDEFGQRMNSIPKYVVSSTLADDQATWGQTTVIKGDVAAEIARLKAAPGGDLLVEGCCQLVQTLVQHGLVDKYRLMVFPIILGAGKRLFPDEMSAALRDRLSTRTRSAFPPLSQARIWASTL
jgi:dihydrofolate reductase